MLDLLGVPGLFTTVTSASASRISGTSLPLTGGQEAALLSNATYLNIHTAANGGGEARGFLVLVPEPTTGLLGLGTLGALAFRRRQRPGASAVR